ncbi:sortase [Candidatus Saccharibacteria bacterium]|nr:MAG: sortase [Candidatus Saccharibacteria bacterium]
MGLRTRSANRSLAPKLITIAAVIFLGGGLYLLSLVSAPMLLPVVSSQARSIDPSTLESPRTNDNRIIIPRIGVNIPYGAEDSSLETGALWRYPDRGSPEQGGNFILAAHRFTLAPTPQQTALRSPFYHIDKVQVGDNVVVDFNGKRYGYEINEIKTVQPSQVEVEAPSDTAKITLYSCGLDGAEGDRIVLVGSPIGEVKVGSDPRQASST